MRGEKQKQKKMSICARMSTRAIQEQNAIKKKTTFFGGDESVFGNPLQVSVMTLCMTQHFVDHRHERECDFKERIHHPARAPSLDVDVLHFNLQLVSRRDDTSTLSRPNSDRPLMVIPGKSSL